MKNALKALGLALFVAAAFAVAPPPASGMFMADKMGDPVKGKNGQIIAWKCTGSCSQVDEWCCCSGGGCGRE